MSSGDRYVVRTVPWKPLLPAAIPIVLIIYMLANGGKDGASFQKNIDEFWPPLLIMGSITCYFVYRALALRATMIVDQSGITIPGRGFIAWSDLISYTLHIGEKGSSTEIALEFGPPFQTLELDIMFTNFREDKFNSWVFKYAPEEFEFGGTIIHTLD